ncbi:WxL domain-containing protein [Enterococcus casseliflavus]|uniref:WxL domain-containing protein n=1 Tax=Enterococcus casseliflavus TaxID=37734 RepID=UPI0037882BB1
MKKKMFFLSFLMISSFTVGGTKGLATEYSNATEAKTDAVVSFTADTDPVNPVDPEDPEVPVDPVDPINPEGAELMITYVSNFNFGTQNKSETTWNALADKVYIDSSKTDTREVVPFVSTKDSRGTDRKGWVLTVKQDGAFIDGNNNELKGAEIELSGLRYETTKNKQGKPNVVNPNITLTTAEQDVAKADSITGIDQWSLALGMLQGNQGKQITNGITLNVPKSTAKNTATYTTSITWELAADPTI